MTPEQRERRPAVPETQTRDHARESPDFGGGANYTGHYEEASHHRREHIPENDSPSPPRLSNSHRTPPEDHIPKGCSLHSMEPLREWFCKGADMTSAVEYGSSIVSIGR